MTPVPAHDPLADSARVLEAIAETLARWFGPHGYHALLTRALSQAQAAHPALAGVRVRTPLTPLLDGLAEAVHAHEPLAVQVGVAAVIAGVIDLLGRVIGDDMARNLLDPSMDSATSNGSPPSSPSVQAGVDQGTIDHRTEGAS